MTLQKLKEETGRIEKIVSGWNEGHKISTIERELVLEKLRTIYEAMLFLKHEEAPGMAVGTETPDNNPETESLCETAAPAPVEEAVPVEEAAAEEPSVPAEPLPSERGETAEKLPIDRRKILSLYESETIREVAEAEDLPVSEEAAADVEERNETCSDETPDELSGGNEKTAVVGEVLGDLLGREMNHTDMATKIAAEQASGLRQMIGLNDKFLLMRDLFDNDRAACDAAINTLDALPDLDEAMIYLHEHYAWNPDSEGVKLLVEVLTRNFS